MILSVRPQQLNPTIHGLPRDLGFRRLETFRPGIRLYAGLDVPFALTPKPYKP